MHVVLIRLAAKGILFIGMAAQLQAETVESKYDGTGIVSTQVSTSSNFAKSMNDHKLNQHKQAHAAPECRHQYHHSDFDRRSTRGHYEFPYHSYRRPWYYPGQPIYNRTIIW